MELGTTVEYWWNGRIETGTVTFIYETKYEITTPFGDKRPVDHCNVVE
jgi:hypothetical protein